MARVPSRAGRALGADRVGTPRTRRVDPRWACMKRMETLGDLFGERRPDDGAPLLVTDDRVVTYGDADARSGQWANLLVERGVRPGDRVAVQVEKSVEAVCLYLACVRGGFVFVPMNPAYTDDEVGHVLHDAEPALFVSEPIAAFVEAVDAAPWKFADYVAEPDILAALPPGVATCPPSTHTIASLPGYSNWLGCGRSSVVTLCSVSLMMRSRTACWKWPGRERPG